MPRDDDDDFWLSLNDEEVRELDEMIEELTASIRLHSPHVQKQLVFDPSPLLELHDRQPRGLQA